MTILKIRNKPNLYFHLKKLKRHDVIEQKDKIWYLSEGGQAYLDVSSSMAFKIVSESAQLEKETH